MSSEAIKARLMEKMKATKDDLLNKKKAAADAYREGKKAFFESEAWQELMQVGATRMCIRLDFLTFKSTVACRVFVHPSYRCPQRRLSA